MTDVGARPRQAAARPVGPASATVVAPADAWQGRRAGVVSRSLAAVLDGFVAVVLLVAGYLSVLGARFLLSPPSFSFPSPDAVLGVAALLGVLVAYLTVAWATTGRTYGNHVMGLRAVGRHGERMRWPWAFLRALGYAIFPLGIAWTALSSENRSVQDVLLRTSVVYDWRPYVRPVDRGRPDHSSAAGDAVGTAGGAWS